jgi:hypothetical protein
VPDRLHHAPDLAVASFDEFDDQQRLPARALANGDTARHKLFVLVRDAAF